MSGRKYVGKTKRKKKSSIIDEANPKHYCNIWICIKGKRREGKRRDGEDTRYVRFSVIQYCSNI